MSLNLTFHLPGRGDDSRLMTAGVVDPSGGAPFFLRAEAAGLSLKHSPPHPLSAVSLSGNTEGRISKNRAACAGADGDRRQEPISSSARSIHFGRFTVWPRQTGGRWLDPSSGGIEASHPTRTGPDCSGHREILEPAKQTLPSGSNPDSGRSANLPISPFPPTAFGKVGIVPASATNRPDQENQNAKD
jgi:hypothetical protein